MLESKEYKSTVYLVLFLFLLLNGVQRVSAQDTTKVNYSLNTSGSFKQGRLNQTILSLDGELNLKKEKWAMDLASSYRYLKTNGILGENELSGRALISILPKNRLHPVIGSLFFKSEFYQIANRNNIGVGAGYRLVQGLKNNITISCWLAYDKTIFESIRPYETFRLNGFLSGNYELIENKLHSQFIFYHLHSLEESSNFIWRIEPSLLYDLSKNISLSLNYRNHFENIIDPSNEQQNSAFTIGLKFQNK